MTLVQTTSALLLTLALSASPAYAQSIDLNAGGGAGANTGGTATADVDANVEAGVDMDAATEDDARADTAANAGAGFTLTRTDASVTNSSGTPMSAESVNTASDLEVFAATTLRGNDAFEGVDVASDRLSFHFKEDAKLFGFIPHRVTSHVVVSGDGSVEVTRPWYSFLVSGLSANTAATIEARVQTALADANGSMSTRTQAIVLSEIASALGGSAAASARSSSSIDMDVDGKQSTIDADAEAVLDVAPN